MVGKEPLPKLNILGQLQQQGKPQSILKTKSMLYLSNLVATLY